MNLRLTEVSANKCMDATVLRTLAYETINTYDPAQTIVAYTDGSVDGDAGRAGYGASIAFPNGQYHQVNGGIGELRSCYEAEATAIERALGLLRGCLDEEPERQTGEPPKHLVIFSDSQSV